MLRNIPARAKQIMLDGDFTGTDLVRLNSEVHRPSFRDRDAEQFGGIAVINKSSKLVSFQVYLLIHYWVPSVDAPQIVLVAVDCLTHWCNIW